MEAIKPKRRRPFYEVGTVCLGSRFLPRKSGMVWPASLRLWLQSLNHTGAFRVRGARRTKVVSSSVPDHLLAC